MGAQTYRPEGPTVQKRRSDRIFIRIPLSIRGTDPDGHDFGIQAVTQTVARFGASIATNLSLAPEQELTLIRTAKKPIRARIIGQTGISPDGHVYGTTFLNSTSDSWGIHFPPLAEVETSSVLLECCKCHFCESVGLNGLEFEVYRANGSLRRICSECGGLTTWGLADPATICKPLPALPPPPVAGENDPPELELRYEVPLAETAIASKPQPQRRHRRLQVALKACIAQPGSDDDIAIAFNMSLGGIAARSQRLYPMEGWVQLAVPYTPAAANIFVPARIVWCAQVQGAYQYGIKYVR